MVLKGHAWDKPSVNTEHKLAVRRVAQAFADKSRATRDALHESLRDIVEDAADFPVQRRSMAFAAISEAVKKLARNVDPLDQLRPPTTCAPCHGRSGGTHHFFCDNRAQQPPLAERRVRDALKARFADIWRRWLALSTVHSTPALLDCPVPRQPCVAFSLRRWI